MKISIDIIYFVVINMVAVVKWLTRRIVAPVCVGSSPISHPIFSRGIAQLVE